MTPLTREWILQHVRPAAQVVSADGAPRLRRRAGRTAWTGAPERYHVHWLRIGRVRRATMGKGERLEARIEAQLREWAAITKFREPS